uniref:Putative secreted protein n=1 Tax=Ixodes ricinus TaxID=34613 RepID=A0A6B0U5L9_IXORI
MLKGSGGTRFLCFCFCFCDTSPCCHGDKDLFLFFIIICFSFPRAHMCMRAHRVQVCVSVCTWRVKRKKQIQNSRGRH